MKRKLLFIVILSVATFALYSFYLSRNVGVVAFGDSLTYGTGSSAGGGFVKMLSEDLNIPITNLGVSGDTTAKALARVEEVTKLKPKVTLVLLGGNDYLQKVSREDTNKNLEEIVKRIKASGSDVILLSVEDILKDIYGVQEMMSDSLHPNDKGYRLMTERIEPVLKKFISN